MREEQILIIGGTRGTGLLITRLLHGQHRRVRVLARDRNRALTLFNSNVEVVSGDLTRPETLHPAMNGAAHVIFTAGIRSGYPAIERRTVAVEYEGVRNTLATALQVGFSGRFLYMTSSGVTRRSLAARCLNLWKGNTLIWRKRAEDEIRASGLQYTIIRTGILLNRPGGQHAIEISQNPLPLAWRYRIARADIAAIFLAALEHPKTPCTTFEAVWGQDGTPEALNRLLDRLKSDHMLNRVI